jgi:hypothetical protein
MKRSSEPLWWAVALMLGLASGYVHVIVPDPTVVALLALASAMFVGFMQPEKPWIWSIILALSLPVADTVMYLKGMPFYRGRIEGAIVAGLVSGIVGGYAGSVGRRNLRNIFEKPPGNAELHAREAAKRADEHVA